MSAESAFVLDVSLDEVRLDGWYEDFIATVPNADLLAEAFGERGIGYLMLAGVRLEAVAFDRSDPGGSVVDVTVAEGRVARAPARVLARRAIEALVDQVLLEGPVPTSDDNEAVRAFLGARLLLVAAMHDIRLVRLRVNEQGEATLDLVHDDDVIPMSLGDVRRFVANQLVEDSRLLEEAKLDPEQLAAARTAALAQDWDAVASTLEPFAGQFVAALRSGAVSRMEAAERADLVEAVDLLGVSQFRRGDLASAETILRLGAQGCRGEPESARLFVRLGEVALARGGAGEAIGALRRAAALGATPRDFAPALARALADRGRHVAALAIMQQGLDDGAPRAAFGAPLVVSIECAGDAFDRVRERVANH